MEKALSHAPIVDVNITHHALPRGNKEAVRNVDILFKFSRAMGGDPVLELQRQRLRRRLVSTEGQILAVFCLNYY